MAKPPTMPRMTFSALIFSSLEDGFPLEDGFSFFRLFGFSRSRLSE